QQYDMAFLQPMKFNNTYAVATTKELADKYNLKEIGDLKQIEDQITAGFTLEFKDRYDGYVGMQDVYNLDIAQVKTMEPGIRQDALANGNVDIIDAYATDSYMIELDLVTLKDPKNLFPPYQGAPLMRNETLDKYPELKEILNQLAGKISDEEMREMNYKVDYDDQSPSKVAKDFLINKNLLDN
ncbi:glycine/betaine ABC transporter permease, partial [Virgibacillus halodenitrificans]|nr:glycine/betaine ABC transporter permease [Virgibacillus halodenitrificans]